MSLLQRTSPTLLRFVKQTIAERHAHPIDHGLQGCLVGQLALGRDLLGQAHRFMHHLARRDHLIGQAQAESILGIDDIACQDQLDRLARAHQARQTLRAAPTRG